MLGMIEIKMKESDIKEIIHDIDDMINGALADLKQCERLKAINSYGAGVAYGELQTLRQIKKRLLTGEWGEV